MLILAHVLVFAAAVDRGPVVLEDIWSKVKGIGPVRTWEVNDICTHVRMTWTSGRKTEFWLPQYRFEAGDFFFVSAIPLAQGRLFVTHDKGAFMVNTRGKVLAEIDRREPKQFIVEGLVARKTRDLPGPFDEEPGWRLIARGWNGTTIAATHMEERFPYLVLIDGRLRRNYSYFFADSKILSVSALGHVGWKLTVKGKSGSHVVEITNGGRFRAGPATRSASKT